MLLKEIVMEGEMIKDISDDLMDLLSVYQQKGVNVVPVFGDNGIIRYLQRLGYQIDVNDLMSMKLPDLPQFKDFILRVEPEKITLKSLLPTYQISKNEFDKSAEKVAKGAEKGAEKIVKAGRM